jgi:hypothetical protein
MNHNESQIQSQELGKENIFTQNVKNINVSLKVIEENEENNQNNEDDSLSYSTLYRSSQNSFNKNSKETELSKIRLSSSQSDITYQELSGFSPDKKFLSQKSKEMIPKHLFSYELDNSIINYFQETENFLKNFYINKNDYQRTKNYIEKDLFFKELEFNNEYLKSLNYKLDYSDEKRNAYSNEIITNNNMNSSSEILEEPSFNEIKINNYNKEKYNKYNYNNDNYNNQIYVDPNTNCNNANGNQGNVSMYYLGFYSFDCKLYKNLLISFSFYV